MGRIDPNTAAFEELLRVPGIGPGTAREIMGVRECRTITECDIGSGRLINGRAAPFLSIVQETCRQATLAGFS
jgi:predicted DNA-binding helix-hairpin-helix protein